MTDAHLQTARQLYHMRLAHSLPRLWIDAGIVRIEIAPDVPKRITWPQAKSIVAGASIQEALAPPPRKKHDWEAWKQRRKAYLRATRRCEGWDSDIVPRAGKSSHTKGNQQ